MSQRYRYTCKYCGKNRYAVLGTQLTAGKTKKVCDDCKRINTRARRRVTEVAKRAAGICRACAEPRTPTSSRFCFRHLRLANERMKRERDRSRGHVRCKQCDGVLHADPDHYHRIAAQRKTMLDDLCRNNMRCSACGQVITKVKR